MKIQLKRSNVLSSGAAKVPTASQLEYGELAVNYNNSDPAIFLKDSNNNVIRISGVGNISDDGLANVPDGTTPPANPEAGNLWYNSDQGRLYIYFTDADSSQWVDASPDSWDPSSYPDLTNSSAQSNTLDDRYAMVNGGNGLKIDSSGNVGIGDTAPSEKLNVAGNMMLEGSDQYLYLTNAGTGNSGIYIRGRTSATELRSHSTGIFTWEITGNEKMRIDSSGNFIVGGTSTSSTNTAYISQNGTYVSNRTAGTNDLWNGKLNGTVTSTINADGSAVFGQAPNNSNATGVGILDAGGAIAVQANGKLFRGHAYSNGAETSAITDAGAATFAGKITGGSSNYTGISLGLTNNSGSNSTIQTQNFAGGTAAVFQGYDNAGQTSRINADGSSTFRGNFVNGTATDYIGTYVDTTQGTVLYGVDANAETWRIQGTGAATFAGNIDVGGSLDVSSQDAVRISHEGYIQARRSSTGSVFYGYVLNSGTPTSVINANGSATFADVITSNKVGAYAFSLGTPTNPGGGLYVESGTSGSLYLNNGTGSGNVNKVAITGSNGNADFAGSISADAGVVFKSTTSDSSAYGFQHNDSSGNALLYIRNDGYYATGTRGNSPYNNTTSFAANLHVNSSGGIARNTSSRKYKDNIQDATHGLAELLQLRPVTYTGKAEADGDTVFGGLIAEEVDDVGLSEFVQYAEDGSPDALAYGNMVSLCIKAIKEQQTVIETLEAKVAALEAG